MKNYLGMSFIILTSLIMLGCGGPSPTSGASPTPTITPTPPTPVTTSITIDNAGTIPIFSGASTSTVIYVHNNSNTSVSGITYTSDVNTGTDASASAFSKFITKIKSLVNASSGVSFIDPASAAACATIAANQSCPLGINTPVGAVQGSAVITATSANNSFSQAVSFATVTNSNGANIASGVNITNAGNGLGYGVVYLYGGGSGELYTINSMTTNKAGVEISQGNITGKVLQSGYVQAVELQVPFTSTSISNVKLANIVASLTVNATDSSSASYTSSVSVSATPTNNTAILVTGIVPLIDTATVSPSGYIYVVNAGQLTATLGTPTYPTGVSAGTGAGACGATLAFNSSCKLYFNVTTSSGNGNATLPYTYTAGSGTMAASIIWYNSKGDPLLTQSISVNPLTFYATVGTSATVTVTNIGGYNMTNFTPANPTFTGSATGTESNVVCTAGGTSLPIGGSCTYSITANDNIAESKVMSLSVSGTYGSSQTYTRILAVPYISNAYTPNLIFVPSPLVMQTIGDGVESDIESVTVTNNGIAPATISAAIIESNPAFLTKLTNNCTGTLAVNASCNEKFRLGPVFESTQVLGASDFKITYTGGSQITAISVLESINYTVLPNTQNIQLTNVTAVGSSGGNGTSGTPYGFLGNVTSGQSITFTYTNLGTNAVTITGESDTNSGIAWSISGSSTCLPGGVPPSGSIPVNGTCTIIYNNVLGTNAIAVAGGIGASYIENLLSPTLVFSDTTGAVFQTQPTLPSPASGTTLYVTGSQATIANTVATAAGPHTATITSTLANATGYAAVTVTTKMEDYFGGTGVPSGGCSVATASGVITQTCVLTQSGGTNTQNVVYTTSTPYIGATLDTLFSLSPAGQIVSMTPIGSSTILQ